MEASAGLLAPQMETVRLDSLLGCNSKTGNGSQSHPHVFDVSRLREPGRALQYAKTLLWSHGNNGLNCLLKYSGGVGMTPMVLETMYDFSDTPDVNPQKATSEPKSTIPPRTLFLSKACQNEQNLGKMPSQNPYILFRKVFTGEV